MGIFTRKNRSNCSTIAFSNEDMWKIVCAGGYKTLDKNPEVVAGVNKIASLISSMPIHLMANTERGDQRIINELSRKIDISPTDYMTRKTWMETIVKNLLLYGDGNSVVLPHTNNGMLGNLTPIPPSKVSFIEDGEGYKVVINGKQFSPTELVHIVENPDENYPWKGKGMKVALKDVANNLAQARETEKSFMESKWMPSMVVKVDAMVKDFADPEKRSELVKKFIEGNERGEPWIVPSQQFDIEQIRPLSLQDIAINETVQIDKRTVASIIDCPPFLLGVGEFNAEAWNNFVNTRIRDIALKIEQELTRKLIINPKWYLRFNMRSLMAYDIEKIANVGFNGYTRGIITGNEVRDWLSMTPKDGLDELVVLENYIPLGMIGDQKKLIQENSNGQNS